MRNDEVKVDVVADTAQFDAAMKALTSSTKDFGRTFASTISSSVRSGRGFDDLLKNLGRRFADLALKSALKPLDNALGNLLGSLAGGGTSSSGGGSIPGFASGAAFSGSGVVPFARGGVVSSPTLFNFGSKIGVMGEKGAEAILPLQRGSDGRLGVASQSAGDASTSIVFNVQATNAASFRKSEGQISTMLARAVSRGQRGL